MPLAHNSAIPLADDIQTLLRGSCRPFDAATRRALYGTRPTDLERFAAAAQHAVAVEVLLPRDVDRLLAEAAADWVD